MYVAQKDGKRYRVAGEKKDEIYLILIFETKCMEWNCLQLNAPQAGNRPLVGLMEVVAGMKRELVDLLVAVAADLVSC